MRHVVDAEGALLALHVQLELLLGRAAAAQLVAHALVQLLEAALARPDLLHLGQQRLLHLVVHQVDAVAALAVVEVLLRDVQRRLAVLDGLLEGAPRVLQTTRLGQHVLQLGGHLIAPEGGVRDALAQAPPRLPLRHRRLLLRLLHDAHGLASQPLGEVPVGVGLVVLVERRVGPLEGRVARVQGGARRVLRVARVARHQVGEAQRLGGHAARGVARVHQGVGHREAGHRDHFDVLVSQGGAPGMGSGGLVEGGDAVRYGRTHHLLHAGWGPALTPGLELRVHDGIRPAVHTCRHLVLLIT